MFPLIVGVLFAGNIGLAVYNPTPITIGSAVMTGCCFLFCVSIWQSTRKR